MNWNTFSWGLLLCLFVWSCSDDEPTPNPNPDPDPDPMMTDPDPMVELKNDGILGDILTDENGATLYYFSLDADGSSACTGNCLTNWPPYFIEDLKVGTGLSASDFGTIDLPDGTQQTTYKGWPLYYFAGDSAPGDTNGEGANDVWWVAKPDYTIMIAVGQLVGHDDIMYNSNYEAGEGMTPYFTDADGRTLYLFVRDEFNTNSFTNADFSNDGVWPIYTTALDEVPSSLNKDDFDIIDVHGRDQLTYRGWPMYYFGQDEGIRGNTKGVSFPRPGVWPIANTNTAEAPMPPMEAVSYADHIAPIMSSSCALGGCHNTASSSAGLDLSSYSDVKTIADNGKLIGSTFQQAGFLPMPRGREKLDDETLATIKAWVDAGAPNN